MKPKPAPTLGLGMAIGYLGAIAASTARFGRGESEPVACRELVEGISVAEQEAEEREKIEAERPKQKSLFGD